MWIYASIPTGGSDCSELCLHSYSVVQIIRVDKTYFQFFNETIGADPNPIKINDRNPVGSFPFIQEPPKKALNPLERILNIIFYDLWAYFPSKVSGEDPYYYFWEVVQMLALDVNYLRM